MTQPATSDNTLIRSVPCDVCGARMLWTQSVWPQHHSNAAVLVTRAAYRCDNGHIIDPAETPQCPACGLHDTGRRDEGFMCHRCQTRFTVPR
jgi:hypothetical protein